MPDSPRQMVEELLSKSDPQSRRRFISEQSQHLDNQIVNELKARADHLMRIDPDRALSVSKLIIEISEITGDAWHRALGLIALGNVYLIAWNEYERAIEIYDEAQALCSANRLPVGEARSQIGKVVALANLGRVDQAMEVGLRSLATLEAHDQPEFVVALTSNLGIVYSRAGEIAESLRMFDLAKRRYRELTDDSDTAWCLIQMNRAVELRRLGRFQEALEAGQDAMLGFEALGELADAAKARQGLALTHFVTGNFNEALANLYAVREFFDEAGRQRDSLLTSLFIGDCLLELRRFADVLELCAKLRAGFQHLGIQDYYGQALIAEAAAYANLDRLAEAHRSLGEAGELFAALGNDIWLAAAQLGQAELLLREGKADECLEICRVQAATYLDHALVVEAAEALLIGARAATLGNQLAAARDMILEADDLLESHAVPALVQQAMSVKADLELQQGNKERALELLEQAIAGIELLRGRLMIEHRIAYLEDKGGIYRDAIRLALEIRGPDQALALAERAKSRALLDMLTFRINLAVRARHPDDQAAVDRLIRLREQRDIAYGAWAAEMEEGERGPSPVLSISDGPRLELFELERKITEEWHRLLIKNADYSSDASLWSVRTDDARPHLEEDTLLIEYFILNPGMVAFLVTREGVAAKRMHPSLDRVSELMKFLWLNMRSARRAAGEELGRLKANADGLLAELFDLLLAPALDGLPEANRIVIVPHGLLHYVPFHALRNGNAYAVERWQMSYLPASSVLRYCLAVNCAESGAVCVGNSSNGLVPFAVTEAERVAGRLKGSTLLEDRATVSRVSERAADVRTLHFAAHGEYRHDNPLFSGLLMADGWITALDVFNLQLSASLAVLSACQTGQQVVAAGDELLGLLRSFLAAGCASVMATLWAVDDRGTAALIEAVYEELVAGATKGAALRTAQVRMLKNELSDVNGSRDHPYFWAPFMLVGADNPL